MHPLSEVAVGFAQAGWHVFPCLPGAKAPATRRGLHAATVDVDRVAAWWARNPAMNIGISCGPSGLVVIDCDAGKPWPLPTPPPPGVLDGSDVLCALAEQLGHPPNELFRTAGVATPSGGLHLYYRAPAGRTLKNTAGKLGAWIDTRAHGGYVVGPWSVLPTGHYPPLAGFDNVLDGWLADAAPLPGWLADALDPPPVVRDPYRALSAELDRPATGAGYVAAAVAGECERVRTAANGARNDVLNRAAFALGTLTGADEPDAKAQLQSAALAAGLSEGESAATICSGWAAGAAHPRESRR